MSERQNYKNSQQIPSCLVQVPQNYNIKSVYNKKIRCICSHEDLKDNCEGYSRVQQGNPSSKNVRFSPKLVVSNQNLPKMAPTCNNKNNEKCCCSNNKEKIIQLKRDLKAIKKCLLEACTNKKQQIELEIKLQSLSEKNRSQREEIEMLKQQNRSLAESVRDNPQTCKDTEALQKDLDEYKNKLHDLYKEFIDSVRIMEEAKKKITKTVDEKSTEFEALQQKFKQKTIEHDELKRAFDDLIETNTRLTHENEELGKYLNTLKASVQQLLQSSAEKAKEQAEFSAKSEKFFTQYNKLARENQQLRKIMQAFIEIVRDNEKTISALKEFIQAGEEQPPQELLESDRSKESYNLIQLIDELNQLMASMYEQIEESFKKDEIIQQQQKEIHKLQSTLINNNDDVDRFEAFLSSISKNRNTTDENR